LGRTPTQISIDLIAMWTALAVYAAIWAIGLGVGIGGVWLPAAVTVIYIGMHVFEIT
jgi:hypothetical protein